MIHQVMRRAKRNNKAGLKTNKTKNKNKEKTVEWGSWGEAGLEQ